MADDGLCGKETGRVLKGLHQLRSKPGLHWEPVLQRCRRKGGRSSRQWCGFGRWDKVMLRQAIYFQCFWKESSVFKARLGFVLCSSTYSLDSLGQVCHIQEAVPPPVPWGE